MIANISNHPCVYLRILKDLVKLEKAKFRLVNELIMTASYPKHNSAVDTVRRIKVSSFFLFYSHKIPKFYSHLTLWKHFCGFSAFVPNMILQTAYQCWSSWALIKIKLIGIFRKSVEKLTFKYCTTCEGWYVETDFQRLQ